jgi:hypothetical protein
MYLITPETNPGAPSLLGTVVADVDGSPVDAVLVEPRLPPDDLPEPVTGVSWEPGALVWLEPVSPASVWLALFAPAPVEPLPVSLASGVPVPVVSLPVSPAPGVPVPVAPLPVSPAALLSAPGVPGVVSEAEEPGVGNDSVVPPNVTAGPPGLKVVEPNTNSD